MALRVRLFRLQPISANQLLLSTVAGALGALGAPAVFLVAEEHKHKLAPVLTHPHQAEELLALVHLLNLATRKHAPPSPPLLQQVR